MRLVRHARLIGEVVSKMKKYIVLFFTFLLISCNCLAFNWSNTQVSIVKNWWRDATGDIYFYSGDRYGKDESLFCSGIKKCRDLFHAGIIKSLVIKS